jgi:hypothetical protein
VRAFGQGRGVGGPRRAQVQHLQQPDGAGAFGVQEAEIARAPQALERRSSRPTSGRRWAREALSLIIRPAGQAPCRAGVVGSIPTSMPHNRTLR